MRDLITILSAAHQQAYEGDQFHLADFRGMALLAPRDVISARGLAPPPSRYLVTDRYRLIEYDAPAWVEESLRVDGDYVPREGDGLTEPDRVEFARLAAQETLAAQIDNLLINSALSVGQLLAYHPDLKSDVVVFLNGARVVEESNRAAGGGVSVRVELPLRRLWTIVRRAGREVEVGAPASADSTP